MSEATARFAWVLNLDAELELAQPSYNPRAKVISQLTRYGASSQALLGPADILLSATNCSPPSIAQSVFIGRAWCPTPRALARLRTAGIQPEPHPTLEVLKRVNHRRFAYELGAGLPNQHYIDSREGVVELLARKERAWLLKRPLAFAGRGQLRAFRELSPKEWSWIDASLKRDGLVIEPLVEPVLELSLHGFLWQDGKSEFGRVCVQDVSERGVFQGVRLTRAGEVSAPEVRALFEQAARVATALSRAGYFGPFGIDAYRYRAQGQLGFCALSEINARYTMGFSTGFPRPAWTLRLDAKNVEQRHDH